MKGTARVSDSWLAHPCDCPARHTRLPLAPHPCPAPAARLTSARCCTRGRAGCLGSRCIEWWCLQALQHRRQRISSHKKKREAHEQSVCLPGSRALTQPSLTVDRANWWANLALGGAAAAPEQEYECADHQGAASSACYDGPQGEGGAAD